MSTMIAIDNYDAEFVDSKTKDWEPCRVIGVTKGEHATVLEFVIVATRHGKQRVLRVEGVRVED